MRITFTRSITILSLLLFIVAGMKAQKTVTGKVTDADGDPLIGANITIKNTTTGTITDGSGLFSIQVRGNDDVLIFDYIGMKKTEIRVGSQTSIDIKMVESGVQLDEFIVTATRQPIRKIEATTAVEVFDNRQLNIRKPEAFSEAIQNAPGMYTSQAQGRRGGVTTRGFPDGSPTGGLVYTGILIDGIPTFGTPGKVPDAGFGFDLNVDRVEIVKGSAATIFGRASAAGVVNMISKVGGDELHGAVRITNYNDILDQGQFNYKLDFNINGPITDQLKFNVGGWLLKDNGFRNTGYNDEGGQIRGNLDYFLDNNKGSIRLYGMYSNFTFQNLTDFPVLMNGLTLAPGWRNTDTYQIPQLADINYRVVQGARNVLDPNGNQIMRNLGDAMADGSFGRGGNIGLNVNLDLGNGFFLENKFRYQQLTSAVNYGFALSNFYGSNGLLRLFLDGESLDTDLINDFRITKMFETGETRHSISAGFYLSNINLKPTTYNYLYASNGNDSPETLVATFFGPPGTPPPATGGLTRRGEYDESVFSFFIGDEMKFNNKLSVNVGLRYDRINLDMRETKIPFDQELTRIETLSDYSASLGINYLLGERSAIYGNINRAFRMPDYSTFTSLELRADGKFLRAPDGIEANEIILNTELGYRSGFKDIGFDIAVFNTQIDNRLASIFEDGLLVSKPLGQNRITGAELALTFTPTAIKGLFARASYTLQNPRFTDFKVPIGRTAQGMLNVDINGNLFGNTLIDEGDGNYSLDVNGNRLPGTPGAIFNTVIIYEHKWFGLDFSVNHNTNRYADATNVLKLDDITVANGGGKFNLPVGNNVLEIGVQIKNLFNGMIVNNFAGLADNDATLAQRQRTPDWTNASGAPLYGHAYIQMPRRILLFLNYTF
ncbi:MAG TPA: TonB-dependent receptor [Saprospiraceae bacterium]|nr:TonB-dependent receptor [Saprospiraceae bacterium]